MVGVLVAWQKHNIGNIQISQNQVIMLVFTVGQVKNVSNIKKNLLAFCAAFLCILIGYLAKNWFQKFFAVRKLTSKRDPTIEK